MSFDDFLEESADFGFEVFVEVQRDLVDQGHYDHHFDISYAFLGHIEKLSINDVEVVHDLLFLDLFELFVLLSGFAVLDSQVFCLQVLVKTQCLIEDLPLAEL